MSDEPNTGSSFFVWIQITAPPGVETATREKFVDAIVHAPKPGFLRAQIFEHAEDPHVFFSLQEWTSEAAFAQHMSDSAEGLRTSNPLLAGPPLITLLRPLGEARSH